MHVKLKMAVKALTIEAFTFLQTSNEWTWANELTNKRENEWSTHWKNLQNTSPTFWTPLLSLYNWNTTAHKQNLKDRKARQVYFQELTWLPWIKNKNNNNTTTMFQMVPFSLHADLQECPFDPSTKCISFTVGHWCPCSQKSWKKKEKHYAKQRRLFSIQFIICDCYYFSRL